MRTLVPCILLLVACRTAPPPAPEALAAPPTLHDVEPLREVGLFAEERERSRVLLAAELKKRGFAVASLDEAARRTALAADGKDPRTGEACGLPLTSGRARARWGAGVGVQPVLSCPGPGNCSLQLEVVTSDGGVQALAAPYPRGGEPLSSLELSLRALQPARKPAAAPPAAPAEAPTRAPFVPGERVGLALQVADVREASSLSPEVVAAAFTGLDARALAACLRPTRAAVDVLLEVTPGAQLRRCEGRDEAQAGVGVCACGVLRAAVGTALAPLAGKRWWATLSHERPPPRLEGPGLVLEGRWQAPRLPPEDPSLLGWEPGSTFDAAACFTGSLATTGQVTSRWLVGFDGKGQSTGAAEQPGHPPLSAAAAACVKKVLAQAKAPCPSAPGLTALVELVVEARAPPAR